MLYLNGFICLAKNPKQPKSILFIEKSDQLSLLQSNQTDTKRLIIINNIIMIFINHSSIKFPSQCHLIKYTCLCHAACPDTNCLRISFRYSKSTLLIPTSNSSPIIPHISHHSSKWTYLGHPINHSCILPHNYHHSCKSVIILYLYYLCALSMSLVKLVIPFVLFSLISFEYSLSISFII